MVNYQIRRRNGEQKIKNFSRTMNSHVSARGMGYMYISALTWKTILVLKWDVAYQIWGLLNLINISFMPLLVHQVAHMMSDFYAAHLYLKIFWMGILNKHIFILSIFWNSASDYCGRWCYSQVCLASQGMWRQNKRFPTAIPVAHVLWWKTHMVCLKADGEFYTRRQR